MDNYPQVKSVLITIALCCGFVALIACQHQSPESSNTPNQPCVIQSGPCTKNLGDQKIIFDITPKPVRAMQELQFTLTVEPPPDEETSFALKLVMPGMYMGENVVNMTQSKPGVFIGKGTIVKCMSGRKDWRAMVLKNNTPLVNFDFLLADN